MDEYQEGAEIVRVYLAATLAEAQQVERALDAAGFRYAVEVEPFSAASAFTLGATRRGAGFWVLAGDLDASADALDRAGLVQGLVLRDV